MNKKQKAASRQLENKGTKSIFLGVSMSFVSLLIWVFSKDIALAICNNSCSIGSGISLGLTLIAVNILLAIGGISFIVYGVYCYARMNK